MAKKKTSRKVVVSDEESSSHSPNLIPSDYELFQHSDSAEEDFGDYDEGTLWPVKGIVSEEIDLSKTYFYQVEWENWKRADGTTTTWQTVIPGQNTVERCWRGLQTKKRQKEASLGPGIDLTVIESFRPHNIHSAEDACAFREKLKAWPVTLSGSEWECKAIPAYTNPVRVGHKRKRESFRDSSDLVDLGSDYEMDIDAPISRSSAFSSARLPSSVASSSRTLARPQSETIWDVESRWNSAALARKAATIRVVNTFDNDVPVSPDFVYLESSLDYGKGVKPPDPGFLIGCDCKDGCRNPLECSCLIDSNCLDEDGDLSPAYDKRGRFLFNNRQEIIECNKNCTCRNCSNDVAQRPRTVPIEIFKSLNNGWGVRSSIFIKRGTVLGLFTGSLWRRKAASTLSPEDDKYKFNLDVRDNDPEFKSAPKYSVVAHQSGNWTRFLNHSCGPTAKVYSVLINTSIQDNMPYLAFVACEDIPPQNEITIDYNPGADRTGIVDGKGKGKHNIDRMACECRSSRCRGFI